MKYVKILFLVGIASLLMFSCVKKTESYLEGQWQRVNLRETEAKAEVWEFKDGALAIYYLSSQNELKPYNSGTYKVQLDGTIMTFETTGFTINANSLDYNATYKIYKKKKDILGFIDTKGFFYEFTRYKN